MVRTKSGYSRISAGKALSKTRSSSSTSVGISSFSGSKAKDNGVGGNSYCPRETPGWQKQITTFFIEKPEKSENGEKTSKSSVDLLRTASSSNTDMTQTECVSDSSDKENDMEINIAKIEDKAEKKLSGVACSSKQSCPMNNSDDIALATEDNCNVIGCSDEDRNSSQNILSDEVSGSKIINDKKQVTVLNLNDGENDSDNASETDIEPKPKRIKI